MSPTRRRLLLGLFGALGLPAAARATPPAMTVRPPARPAGAGPLRVTANAAFDRWLGEFRQRAGAAGLDAATLDAALSGIRYNADVIQRDRTQAEFVKPIWTYLDSAVSDTRVANGRAALQDHRAVLDRIEARHRVEAGIVAAIWGLESAYGAVRGSTPTIEALATLAFDGRRGAFFERELVAALRILQRGEVSPAAMTGSWAGAMGHTQFIPTSYLAHAVDFDGDGRRDIWGDDPADALASAAAYLSANGWQPGQPWGVEVTIPAGWDYALADRRIARPPSQWAGQGIAAADGSAIPDHAPASVLLPAGAEGAAFLIFPNFAVLERYNTADAYVIAVGHLADRITGGPPLAGEWPRGDRALLPEEREELQRRLTEAGFSTRGIDGRIGPRTIAAIRAYQKAEGLVPDGYASARLLDRLRN